MIRLRYQPAPDWPPLAWLARLPGTAHQPGTEAEVLVTHGRAVETRDDWFGEIVWAGDLDAAGFDQTEVVFGTGARLRGQASGKQELIFVPPATMTDRIQSIESGGYCWVSNSLACLLAQVGGEPDPLDATWFDRMGAAMAGIRDYERMIPTSAGEVRLTYFHNLAWRDGRLREVEKPDAAPGGFGTFESYCDFLRRAVAALAPNAADARRAFPMPLLGTISSGFDSPMVSAIAREAAGLREAFSFRRPDGTDSGEEIARILDLDVTYLERDAWRKSTDMPEVPFIAGDAKGEDVFMHAAADLVRGRTMLSGHYGGIILNRNWGYPNDVIQRRDRSGTFTEWRLIAGCIHAAVFFLGARHATDVYRISTSEQMRPWSLGGWYDRPIARRLLEEAGVPREAFGITKRAASVLFIRPGIEMTEGSARDYTAWLRRRWGDFLRGGRIPPTLKGPVNPVVGRLAALSSTGLLAVRKRLPRHRGGKLERLAKRLHERGRRDPLFDYAFPWAMSHLKRAYPPVAGLRAAVASADRSEPQ